jgi:FtsP/CotA-like multicopper oxidase with cupredoxin domain
MTLSRRAFAITAARAAVAAAAGASLSPRRLTAAEPDVRTIRLEAREVRWELAPGKVVRAMAYNGEVPGPAIRAREGERLRIVLENALSEPTTIHWHGVDVPNAMDGVPGVTQTPVPPGQTFAYEFEARPAGTRWYHTHFDEHRQMDLGLVAPLIVEARGPEPLSYDREVTLVLDDWATGTGRPVPNTDAGTAGGRGRAGGMMSGMMGGGMSGMMGGRGTADRPSDAGEPAYDVMTINGKAYPATAALQLKKGERVRLRIVNASAEHTHVVRLAGHPLRVTHTDGNPLQAPVEVDAVPIAPAERYDVIVAAERPGAWFFYCTQPGHVDAGERMPVVYDGWARATPPEPERGLAGLRLWEYGLGRGRDGVPRPSADVRAFTLTLSGGMDGGEEWTINGKRYPHTDPLRCREGERVRIAMRNMSMEAHPMHLHGQSFRLLAMNGRRYAAPLVKDVVDVEPHMGTAVVELTARAAGDWLFHCHKPMHMMGGMATLLKIA